MFDFQTENSSINGFGLRAALRIWVGPAQPGDGGVVALPEAVEMRARRFRDPEARARFRARQARVRKVLARWLACSPESIALVTDLRGKPHLSGHDKVTVSWSHSEGWLAVAMAESRAIGADLQVHLPLDRRSMLNVVAGSGEAAQVGTDEAAFFRLWCAKEAVAKADGLGLGKAAKHITLSDRFLAGQCENEVVRLGRRHFSVSARSIGLGQQRATLALARAQSEPAQPPASTISMDRPLAS